MKKYYTPTIEEFHVGFKFESQDIENAQWGMCICTPGFGAFDDDMDDLEDGRIRVKYLDREDIEDLGFIWDEKKEEYTKEGEFTYVLGFNPDKPEQFNIRVFARYINYKDKLIMFDMFLGDVKNKSELKKLLQQLNIC